MFCQHCGEKTIETSNFCSSCGHRLTDNINSERDKNPPQKENISANYRVITNGIDVDKNSIGEVKNFLKTKVKLKENLISSIVNGRPVIVKSGIDKEKAHKYKAVLEKNGVKIVIVKITESKKNEVHHEDLKKTSNNKLEKPIGKYFIAGVNGQIKIGEKGILILRNGFLALGKYNKYIPIDDIKSIQFSESSPIKNGYIFISTQDELSEIGYWDAGKNENSVYFKAKNLSDFTELYRYVKSVIEGKSIDFLTLNLPQDDDPLNFPIESEKKSEFSWTNPSFIERLTNVKPLIKTLSKEDVNCESCGSKNNYNEKICVSCGVEISSTPIDHRTYVNKENHDRRRFDFSNLVKGLFGLIPVLIVLYLLSTFVGSSDPSSTSTSTSTPASTSRNEPSDADIIKLVWDGYMAWNKGANEKYYSAEILKRGTVPPSAMRSSVQFRLPAYLVCYDVLMVTSFGDSRLDYCVYYIGNPETRRVLIQARGKVKISELESLMSDDGFTLN